MTDPVRDAIVTVIRRVPEVGQVHNRERFAKDSKRLLDLYGWPNPNPATGAQAVRGWFVSLLAEAHRPKRVGRATVLSDWRMTGFLGFEDAEASELVMADLARAIVAAFRADPTLGGVIARQSDSQAGDGAAVGPQIQRIEPVMFCGVLTHRASLTLTTERFTE